MEIDKHTKHYFNRLVKWYENPDREPQHKIYEVLCALNENMILWDDIPPNFCEIYNVPHRRDYGIDIISRDNTLTGQAKFYGEKSAISWRGISTFFGYSRLLRISEDKSVILTTPDSKIDSMANTYIEQFNIKLKRMSIEELRDNIKPYLKTFNLENNTVKDSEKINIEPRDFILECFDILTNKNQDVFRFQLPPGVGKSFIMFYTIVETLKKNKKERFVIFVPWIQLAEQHKKFLDNLNIKNQIIGDGNKKVNKTPNVFICVNPSSKYLEGYEFKFKFIDEAHHLENEDSKYRQAIDEIVCEKEIQLTATFKNENNIDYLMPFREGIEKGYITDYKVVIEYFTTGNKTDSLIDLITKRPEWFPAFIYFNSTDRAKMFKERLCLKGVRTEYVTAETGSKNQKKIIERIESGDIDLVCLVGCWNEGTSIDNIRTVILGEMRYSSINRIQIIMRGNRLHTDKPFYNIVVPIIANDISEDGECYDDLSNFVKTLVRIDPKLKESIKKDCNSSRIKIGIDTLYSEENLDEDLKYDEKEEFENPAIHITESIYDSLGNMAGGLSIYEKAKEFIEEVEKNGIPKQGKNDVKFSDKVNMGTWFHITIKRILTKESELYKLLSENEIIKNEIDRYLKDKDERSKNIKLLTRDEKLKEFIEEVEKNGIPNQRNKDVKFSDKISMGRWFQNTIKKKLTKESEIYQLLSVNETIKNEMNRYLREKDEKPKNNKILTLDEKIKEFIEYVEKNGIPSHAKKTIKFSDKVVMGVWFHNIKNKLTNESEIYQILLENETVKNNIDIYLKKKDEKPKNNKILTQNEKIKEFIEYVGKNGIPSCENKDIKFSDKVNMGRWFYDIKKKLAKESEIYQLLSENETVKNNIDIYLKKKDEKPKDIKLLTRDEKIKEFIGQVKKMALLPGERTMLNLAMK